MAKQPSNTQVKIRYGLILQGVLAEALRRAGFSFDETAKYKEGHEVPDFLIPNTVNPTHMIEVHQTEARDHFRMKTLRSLTAIAEAKSTFGGELISVNVLFGNPRDELPEANVKAMCGLFDENVFPQYEVDKKSERAMEEEALRYAEETSYTTAEVVGVLSALYDSVIGEIASMMRERVDVSVAKPKLIPLWEHERMRRSQLGPPPSAGAPTYYKSLMLKALYLSDEGFNELAEKEDPAACSASVIDQLLIAQVVTKREDVDGDYLDLDHDFAQFLEDPAAASLRAICKQRLDREPQIGSVFDDIRNKKRRATMAETLVQVAAKGPEALKAAFEESFANGDYGGVEHGRCWIADMLPSIVGRSHNYFNQKMFRHPAYDINLGNPYNNITIRSPRLGRDPRKLRTFVEVAFDVFLDEIAAQGVDLRALDPSRLEHDLFQLRLTGASRLQKMNPLELVVEEECRRLGLTTKSVRVKSIISSLAGSQDVGVFTFFLVTDGKEAALLNAIAADDNPQDKAKEWGARRLAISYRTDDGGIEQTSLQESIFVIDGVWEDDDVARLHRGGWTHVCRLGDLGTVLESVFGI